MTDPRVALLDRMLRIPSPSGHERPLAEALRAEMTRLGLPAHLDQAGNVVATGGRGGGPEIMLLGHIDTVPGGPPARREGDLLFGRGAVDAKGSFAAMICAAAALSNLPATIRLVGAVEEETPGSRGAKHLLTGPRPDAVVVGEPSGSDTVVIGYKGRVDLHYQVHCPPVHTSHWLPKAPEVAAEFWHRLDTLVRQGPGDGQFQRLTAALCAMTGTLTDAELTVVCRTPPGFDLDDFLATAREFAAPGRLELHGAVAATHVDRSNPVVRALTRAIRTRTRPRHAVKTGTSDMNTLAEVWDVPMATYGPGDSRLDHTDHEHVTVAEYLAAVDVLTDAVRAVAADLPTAPGLPAAAPNLGGAA